MAKNDYFQDDKFIIKGYWWLPESEHRIAGELDYNEEKMLLSLYGGLSQATIIAPFNAPPDIPEHNIVHGNSLDNNPITLLKCFYTNWTPDITSFAVVPQTQVSLRTSTLNCSIMFDGIHLSSENETFSKCHLTIPFLDDWIGTSPFNIQSNSALSEMNINYSRPDNEDFEITDHCCHIRFIHSVAYPGSPLGPSPQIRHSSYVEIEPFEPQDFKWFINYSSEIIDLLGIVYGGPLVSKQIKLFKNTDGQQVASIYYNRKKAKTEHYERNKFMVRYENIKSGFQEILKGWLNATYKEKLARSMLISNERRPPDFIELRFLPLAHAAEVLSYETKHSTIVDKSDFKKFKRHMLATLPDNIPNELLESINNSLQWANGRNLKRKLKSILNQLEEKTRQLFSVDSDKFIDGIVNTRNHYTHYSTKPGRNILQGIELHWGIQKLSLMIRILLLIRAGIDEQAVQMKLWSDNRLAGERAVWREISEEGSEYIV